MKNKMVVINWKVSREVESKVDSSRRFESILHQVTKLEYGKAGVCILLENPNPDSLSLSLVRSRRIVDQFSHIGDQSSHIQL